VPEPQHIDVEGAGAGAASGARRRPPARLGLLAGELMAGAGVFLVLFLAWLVWGGQSQPDAHQRAADQAVVRAWTRGPAQSAADAANAAEVSADQTVLLRIPALGAGWEYPVYEGISEDNLDKGIAHYSQTAGPGMVGNYAIAGHRSSDIGFRPWADLPDLVGRGSTVVVLTRNTVYTYVIDASEQTTPYNLAPLQPDQGRGADPNTRLITLTTCTPRFGSTGRFILFGHLAGQRPFVTGDH